MRWMGSQNNLSDQAEEHKRELKEQMLGMKTVVEGIGGETEEFQHIFSMKSKV